MRQLRVFSRGIARKPFALLHGRLGKIRRSLETFGLFEHDVVELFRHLGEFLACALAFQSGKADVIGALTRNVSAAYAATFVPGIAKCPEVAYIVVREEDKRAFDKENR